MTAFRTGTSVGLFAAGGLLAYLVSTWLVAGASIWVLPFVSVGRLVLGIAPPSLIVRRR